LSVLGRAAPGASSRPGFKISLPSSGLGAPSSFRGGGEGEQFPGCPLVFFPTGILSSPVPRSSTLCYLLLLLPEGLGLLSISQSSLSHQCGTPSNPPPALQAWGILSPFPVSQGTPPPRGPSHPSSECVLLSSPEDTRVVSMGRSPACLPSPPGWKAHPPIPPPGGRSLFPLCRGGAMRGGGYSSKLHLRQRGDSLWLGPSGSQASFSFAGASGSRDSSVKVGSGDARWEEWVKKTL
jgi:hypothetical protein